jgi:hypothetical protein
MKEKLSELGESELANDQWSKLLEPRQSNRIKNPEMNIVLYNICCTGKLDSSQLSLQLPQNSGASGKGNWSLSGQLQPAAG